MTKIITKEVFTAAMEEAVKLRGKDYTYPSIAQVASDPRLAGWRNKGDDMCKYQVSGEPACLIGLALYLIDPDLVPGEDVYGGADVVLDKLGASEDVALAASYAQDFQDEGYTWGEALTQYKSALR